MLNKMGSKSQISWGNIKIVLEEEYFEKTNKAGEYWNTLFIVSWHNFLIVLLKGAA